MELCEIPVIWVVVTGFDLVCDLHALAQIWSHVEQVGNERLLLDMDSLLLRLCLPELTPGLVWLMLLQLLLFGLSCPQSEIGYVEQGLQEVGQ